MRIVKANFRTYPCSPMLLDVTMTSNSSPTLSSRPNRFVWPFGRQESVRKFGKISQEFAPCRMCKNYCFLLPYSDDRSSVYVLMLCSLVKNFTLTWNKNKTSISNLSECFLSGVRRLFIERNILFGRKWLAKNIGTKMRRTGKSILCDVANPFWFFSKVSLPNI